MIVIGLDPGTTQSTLVAFDGSKVRNHMTTTNEVLCERMREDHMVPPELLGGHEVVLVIEEFESYGMAVGREVFRTIRWAGNFEAFWHPGRVEFISRRIVKQHICHTTRATDANIRTELIDRFGGLEKAVGKKASPGPLYGIKSHAWAALAVAVTWHDLNAPKPNEVRPGIPAEF